MGHFRKTAVYFSLLLLVYGVFFASPALAQAPAKFCDLEIYFTKAIQAFVGLVGLAAFITILMGGFQLITSGGDAKASSSAKNSITFGIIGIALIVASIFILRFIYIFTGVNVLNFTPCI